jgi:hypothetical protein
MHLYEGRLLSSRRLLRCQRQLPEPVPGLNALAYPNVKSYALTPCGITTVTIACSSAGNDTSE